MVTGLTSSRSGRHSNRERRNRDDRDRGYRDDRGRGYGGNRGYGYGDDRDRGYGYGDDRDRGYSDDSGYGDDRAYGDGRAYGDDRGYGYADDRDRGYGDDGDRDDRSRDDRPRGRGGRKRGRIRRAVRKPWVRIVLAGFGVFLCVVGWSIGHALTLPGGGSVSERLAEWARDHYLGPLVTFGEWVSYSPPKAGGKPSFALTGPSAAVTVRPKSTGSVQLYGPPPPLKSPAGKPLPGEGKWRVLGTVNGNPAIYGTYLRASNVYTSYVAGIASMNQSLLRFQLRPGAEDPGPGNWKLPAEIPPPARRGLEATFNGGFKISVSGGGFYLNGATSGRLTRGIASVVYYKDGHINIGIWGQTVHMTPDVVGVRQNLHLIVQNGKVPASVNYNVESAWGATLGGGYYVWRSGIGVTSDGRVIFVYGPSLNVSELAHMLQEAGAVTAMQLDINPDWMSYMYYFPGKHPANPTPHNLLPDQIQPPDRFYSLASRDFTAVYAR